MNRQLCLTFQGQQKGHSCENLQIKDLSNIEQPKHFRDVAKMYGPYVLAETIATKVDMSNGHRDSKCESNDY